MKTCRLINNDWSKADSVSFQQGWLRAPQPELLPATVRTAWRDDALLVQAELSDADIFNPLTDFNGEFYTTGDVFEIFLQPVGQEAYYEFHVGPANQKFQLRLPAPGVLRRDGFKSEFLLPKPVFTSRVEILPGRWRVHAEVPFAVVQETGTVKPGTQWRYSFCRYDYTRGAKAPVLSSSSPHRQLDYHRVHEWGMLTFV